MPLLSPAHPAGGFHVAPGSSLSALNYAYRAELGQGCMAAAGLRFPRPTPGCRNSFLAKLLLAWSGDSGLAGIMLPSRG